MIQCHEGDSLHRFGTMVTYAEHIKVSKGGSVTISVIAVTGSQILREKLQTLKRNSYHHNLLSSSRFWFVFSFTCHVRHACHLCTTEGWYLVRFLRGANSKSLSTRWRTEQRGTARRWGWGPVRLCHQQPTTWDPHPTPCTPSTFIFLLLNRPTHPSTSHFPLCRPFSFSSTSVAPRPNRATELTS